MEFVAFVAILLCFFGFQQYLRHHRRILIHRERMTAIEKGVDLPPLEQEIRKNTWNVQRILLLSGLTWMFLGVAVFVVLSVVMSFPSKAIDEWPKGLQFVGLGPIAVGLPQLIVYYVGKSKEKQS